MKKQRIFKNSSLVDFHIHSNASIDGSKNIDELCEMANENNTSIFSVTDHNTINGINTFLDKNNIDRYSVLSSINNTTILSGVEITAKIKEIENIKGNPVKVHLLAYGIDRNDNSPISQILKLKRKNDENVDLGFLYQINQQLNLNIPTNDIINFYRTKKQKNERYEWIGKNDAIEFLLSHNFFKDKTKEEINELFYEMEPTHRLDLEAKDVINLVHASGGIVTLAHPYSNLKRTKYQKEVINYLISYEIDGFEMYYPFNNYHCDLFLRSICKDHNIKIFSGGSDYHTDTQEFNDELHIPFEPVTINKTRAFIDYMTEIEHARKKGTLILNNYKNLNSFKIQNTIEKYKKKFCSIENISPSSLDILEME